MELYGPVEKPTDSWMSTLKFRPWGSSGSEISSGSEKREVDEIPTMIAIPITIPTAIFEFKQSKRLEFGYKYD